MATVYTRFGCELTFANLDCAKARGYAAVQDVLVHGCPNEKFSEASFLPNVQYKISLILALDHFY